MTTEEALSVLRRAFETRAVLLSTSELIRWDREVRSAVRQQSYSFAKERYLEQRLQDLLRDKRLAEAVALLWDRRGELDRLNLINVTKMHRRLDRVSKLPDSHAAEFAAAISKAEAAYKEALRLDDFNVVKGCLGQVVACAQREAQLLGHGKEPYDAFLDLYEPELRFDELQRLLTGIERGIELGTAISCEDQVCIPEIFNGKHSESAFHDELLRDVGLIAGEFTLDIGDYSCLFCVGPRDQRIVIDRKLSWLEKVWALLHEGGHALYENSLSIECYREPWNEVPSIACHEAIARFYETCIGHSIEFANYLVGSAKVSSDRDKLREHIINAALRRRIGWNRVSSDEVTYSLHVIVRVELERGLLNGGIKVSELEEAWNCCYRERLGVKVERATQGVLQELSWFVGSFGYFPCYLIGSVIAALLYERCRRIIPEISTQMNPETFGAVRRVLNEQIFACRAATSGIGLMHSLADLGRTPEEGYLAYLKERYRYSSCHKD